ncbi:hypothetical protein [Limnobaculum xujianqingii]|uniref:hypothetical protein n=1 Tax=Limnobaculum xujianqingii TaxID=2738837 RepID=UPI001129D486|nr:hypothetical protein [Limnobaculum xujianqingii]
MMDILLRLHINIFMRKKSQKNHMKVAEEIAALPVENESNDDSSSLVSQIVGIVGAGIMAEASGGDAMQAINNGLADMAVNNSDNPELMSSVRSGLDSMTQAANRCDYSTPSGFKSCCKNQIKGKLSSTSNSDGTVSYGCLHPDKIGTREGCTYSGNTMVNVCAISP